ncbi:cytochrome P450 [Candidatus Bathyarchaeota archaeon]|nr:cytochrome P450 [Candidatus Bathyarchaeota archaeon]
MYGLHLARFPSKNISISPVLADIKREYDLGDIFYLDLWPVGPCFMILAAPDAAAIPTTVQVAPQSHEVINLYRWTLGAGFMDATNGALWKYLHRVIAPTLTASAIRARMPFVISEAAALHARLKALSDRDVTVDLGYEVGRFPFEVLLRVFLGDRPDSSTSDRLYDDSRGFATAVGDIAYRSPSPLHSWWLRMTSLRHLKNRIESTLEGFMDRKHAEMVQIKDQGLLDKNTSLPTMGSMMLDAVLNERPLNQGLRRLIIEK